MRIWPAKVVQFPTSFTATEAIARLHADIGPPTFFIPLATTDRRSFLGQRTSAGGRLTGNLNSVPGDLRTVNSWQAVIDVRIEPTPSGSLVTAIMRLHPAVLAFMSFWALCLLVLSGALILSHGSNPDQESAPAWAYLIGPTMVLIGLLVTRFAFFSDADNSDRLLRAILERD